MARDPSTRELERLRTRKRPRRQRLFTVGLLALVLAAAGVAIGTTGGGHRRLRTSTSPGTSTTSVPPPRPVPSSFAVGLHTERFVDTSRAVKFLDGTTEPRTLTTYIRYPALGSTSRVDVPGLAPARADGPFPLIVFGHGFDEDPALYRHLLASWAKAGYVVAAPVFPLESPEAHGGPLESDLVNQPMDMHFVIDQLLQASIGSGPLAGLIDPKRIAVAGQSDGGDTALALAYDARFRDRRIDAAAILSGAEIPALGSFTFPRGGPPLLATQGTADTVNPPSATAEYFAAAHRPKYLLRLLGAEHLGPYSVQQPQLGIVERTTLAFFDAYLKHRQNALQELASVGSVAGTATLQTEP
jgi:fermentation-respiration switch protein FrsA (DUF1100 family)